MLSLRRRLFSFAIVVPVTLVVACSGDDAPATDAGTSSDGSHADGSPLLDSGNGTDGSSGTDGGGGNDAGGGDGNTSRDSSSNDGSTTQDSQSSFDASDDIVITDSGTCNALANGGAFIPETQVAADPPNATGGVLPHPSLWYFTKWEVYTGNGGATGPTGNQRKVAFQFGASVYYKVTVDLGGGAEEHDTRTWSTNGTTLVSNQVCPTIDNLTSDYSYSGNTLVLIAGQNVLTFTRQ